MKLLGIQKLAALKGRSDQMDRWISSWVSELTHANWKRITDVTEQFPSMVIAPNDVYLFPVENTGIDLRLKIAFVQGIAIIIELSEKS